MRGTGLTRSGQGMSRRQMIETMRSRRGAPFDALIYKSKDPIWGELWLNGGCLE